MNGVNKIALERTLAQETHLTQLAARDGREPKEMAEEAVARFLEDDAHFAAAVNLGIKAADRGEFVEPGNVWASVEEVLRR